MKSTILLMAVATLITLAAAPAEEVRGGVDARAAFSRLKLLAGEWQGSVPGQAQPVTVLYRVSSSGNAVVETLFPGSEHEMLTVYHLDGGKLVLTHYCSAGNQPKMALTRRSTPEGLVFDFIGGSNVKPKKDPHMHALRLHFHSADQLTAEWDFFKGGKKASTEKFTLTRVKAKT